MQIKIYSTQDLSSSSVNHVESLLDTFQWHSLPTSVQLNIDCTLKDVDDKLYVQLITFFGKTKLSFIADGVTITEALNTAMSTLNSGLTSTQRKLRKGRSTVYIAA